MFHSPKQSLVLFLLNKSGPGLGGEAVLAALTCKQPAEQVGGTCLLSSSCSQTRESLFPYLPSPPCSSGRMCRSQFNDSLQSVDSVPSAVRGANDTAVSPKRRCVLSRTSPRAPVEAREEVRMRKSNPPPHPCFPCISASRHAHRVASGRCRQ